jgi:MFS family permease
VAESTAVPAQPNAALEELDEAKVSAFQWKIMFVSGMGFFTDAYDLFVIGIVVAIITKQWHLSTDQVSLVASTTLAASAVGAVVFGRVADILGRKKIYGYEVLILGIGALASAFSPNVWWLIVFRIILGIGIGGDYPVSATIMSEYSGKKSRGRMVGLVFAMQGAGLVVGPLIAALLLATGMNEDYVWRILLALGAIPGLAVFYLRRQIHETPRFAMAGGAEHEADAAVAQATGRGGKEHEPPAESSARHHQSALGGFGVLAKNRRLLMWLFGAAGAWFLLDFAYYGNTISSPKIIELINPSGSLLANTLVQLGIFVVFAVPGYACAILLMDKTGRKSIQVVGFGVMALAFGTIGLVPGVTTSVTAFVIIFGISYFFTEFGPNTTTFIYPAEIFPVDVRTTGHGIAAAMGKMGAFFGVYAFPHMLAAWGLRGSEIVASVVCLMGLVLTVALLPETKGRSLEDLTAEAEEAGDVGAAPRQLEPAVVG